MAQVGHDGEVVMAPRLAGLSRSLFLAVCLHGAGGVVLGVAIRYWPAEPVTPPMTGLDLDLATVPTQVPVPEGAPVLAQALSAVGAEIRPEVLPVAPIPEARSADIPEPTAEVLPVRGEWSSETFQMPGEEAKAVAAAAIPIPDSPHQAQGARPIALSGIQPHYPHASRIRGETGTVSIHVKVSRRGDVESAGVSKTSGYLALDESALSATRKARFKPAEKDGQAVPAEMELCFDFRLQD